MKKEKLLIKIIVDKKIVEYYSYSNLIFEKIEEWNCNAFHFIGRQNNDIDEIHELWLDLSVCELYSIEVL